MEKKVKVEVGYEDGNYSAVATFGDFPGMVIVTRNDYPALQDADDVPAYLARGEYEFAWELSTQALIRSAEPYTSIAAIARASGINQSLLSHYATGVKRPRPKQRQRIVAGLHRIGQNLMAIV